MIERFSVALIIVALVLWGAHWKTSPSPHSSQQKIQKKTNIHVPSQPQLPKEPISLLLIGIDKRKGDPGRTDALIVLTINPKEQTIKIVNIPRDLKTQLFLSPKRIIKDKINHAYALGNGAPATVRTIEHFLDIPIDHYIKVNMKGFRALIDSFDGVDIVGTREFSSRGHHFIKGKMHLNGDAALAYVRDRTGSSDFDRHLRQQQVLYSLWGKMRSFSSLLKADEFLMIVRNHVETSLTPFDMWHLQATIRSIPKENIETLRISGQDQWADHYYFIVSKSERQRIRHILQEHLELDRPSQHEGSKRK